MITGFQKQYEIKVGELANEISQFHETRNNGRVPKTNYGLQRALYSTYVSFLPESKWVYNLKPNVDQRGLFVELLKTEASGQFSFFIAERGVTRGGHYHHTKTEKFFVVSGTALFRFRNIETKELKEYMVRGDDLQVIQTIPGWSHDVVNIGENQLLALVWANENFDPQAPDTIVSKVADD